MYNLWYQPVVRDRIAEPIDYNEKITKYDVDNLYPQRVKVIRKKSPLVSRSTEVIRDVLFGKGWENEELANSPANDLGHTWNDLAKWACSDESEYNGFGILSNFNGLGEPINPFHISFEFIRFGIPDERGRHVDVKLSNNWEQDGQKLPTGSRINAVQYPLWNRQTAQRDALISGQGQVLYITPKPDSYPVCPFDSVLDSAQADGEIQSFELSSIQFGFLGAMIMKIPQGSMSDQDKAQLQRLMTQMMGAQGGKFIGIEWPEGENFGSSVMEALPANNNDALFTQTFQNIQQRILQALGMPSQLVGQNPQGGFINEAQYRDGFKYVNLIRTPQRERIERAFALLNPDLGKLVPLDFVNDSPNQEGQNQFTGTETEEEEPIEEDASED